ncbi:unnamed protein product [Caenorhabditis bovis]|uniref:C-type lectin domain-containing protein n=1 Tax=Caenorhabditis bovis TaxID=2654633 RepID=A0A8S1EU46_9PELO|nr:unnamed protein product [Caenorhabditis bovis]
MKTLVASLALLVVVVRCSPCPRGWNLFDRKSGGWCIGVFSGTVTRDAAEEECQGRGATLSGIESAAERRQVVQMAKASLQSINQPNGAFWLGAKRKDNCMGTNYRSGDCIYNQFEWTDGETEGVRGFYFRPGQPDNSQLNQNCLYMFVGEPNTPDRWGPNNPGEMDDSACTYSFNNDFQNKIRAIQGFVCGRPAVS